MRILRLITFLILCSCGSGGSISGDFRSISSTIIDKVLSFREKFTLYIKTGSSSKTKVIDLKNGNSAIINISNIGVDGTLTTDGYKAIIYKVGE